MLDVLKHAIKECRHILNGFNGRANISDHDVEVGNKVFNLIQSGDEPAGSGTAQWVLCERLELLSVSKVMERSRDLNYLIAQASGELVEQILKVLDSSGDVYHAGLPMYVDLKVFNSCDFYIEVLSEGHKVAGYLCDLIRREIVRVKE